MSLTKTNIATVNENTRALEINNKMLMKAARRLNTFQLLYIIITRHKFAILATIAATQVLDMMIPMWGSLLVDILRSLV